MDRAGLEAMRDSMVRRGPDGAGTWIAEDGRVGFAHRRLAIIGLGDAGAQPMVSADGRLVIVFNGEIYNYKVLRAELEAQGVRFATATDTEVLLQLYRRDGRALVERLRGMYAFAIWDLDKRGLLLARDPFGIKPLYYADDGRGLAFASQVKALQAGGLSGGLDAAGAVGFFLFGAVPEPFTIDRAVRSLPAGHTLWADEKGSAEPSAFFDLGCELAAPGPASDLPEALRDSIAHHLVADVPVGVFLSAGLDSATIAALASEAHGAGLHSFTLGFEEFRGTARDEVPFAEAAARAFATAHRTRRVAAPDFAAARDDLLAAMDQPTIDGVNTYFVARAARETGLKVALSGLGGDELFGGYDTFRQVPRLVGALGWIPGGRVLGKGLRAVSASFLRGRTSPKWAGVLEYGTRYGDAYLLRRGLFMPWELPEALDPDLVREGWRRLDPLARLDALQAPLADPRRKVQVLETSWYMRNQLLRDADWAGMAHSLEIRVPLVDIGLFRAIAALEAGKRDMARAVGARLPEVILNRPKTGFFIPVQDWLQGVGAEPGYRGWAKRVFAAFS
ncbi:MAG: asparagine synthase (glutamine-hydrolyzing) [Magnetospirillum sp. WYHS-4]